jgi:hypothetical protein
MLKKFKRAKNVLGVRFAFAYLEKKADRPDEETRTELAKLFGLIGLVGDEETFRSALNLFDRMVREAWLRSFQCYELWDMRQSMAILFISPMLEGAAESGRLNMCEQLLLKLENPAPLMLKGGSRGNSIEVCKKVIELGGTISPKDIAYAARHGSAEVFGFLLKRYIDTVQHPFLYVSEKTNIEEGIYSGHQSVIKFEILASAIDSAKERLFWAHPDPNAILFSATEFGSIEMCRYAKEKGATDLSQIYTHGPRPITPEILALGIEWGIDINIGKYKILSFYASKSYDSSSDALSTKRRNRKKDLAIFTTLCDLLLENGYHRYGTLLKQAIRARCREAIEKIIKWGKYDPREGTEDYEEFKRLRALLPNTPEGLASRFPDDIYAKLPK